MQAVIVFYIFLRLIQVADSFNFTAIHGYNKERSQKALEENEDIVAQHNELFQKGVYSYRLGLHSMAGLNNTVYLKSFLRLFQSKRMSSLDSNADIGKSTMAMQTPESVDWRARGFETGVENQKSCGACYAFSVGKTVEGQVFRRTGALLNLSTQQIVDCSTTYGNQGCIGGTLRNTFKYLQDSGGLMMSQDYRYASTKNVCKFVKELAVVNITSWTILPTKDEAAIEVAVAFVGPVAVSINATPKTFQLYSDGIYSDPACSSDYVNHAMLVVGYTKKYWIIKNWWGPMWGENGYMRLEKGRNMCGVANYAAFAVV